MTLFEYLISKNFSKKESEAYIRSGKVMVNQEVIFIPSFKIKKTDLIKIKKMKKWVSRGALKLLGAIEEFKINFNDKIVLDIGSSTGGFTQVALEFKARKVYALDVGTNQLDFKLRSDKRVISLEKTNLKTINNNMFGEKIDIVVTDVSFISLKHVFNVLDKIDNNNLIIIALIKPQFEAEKDLVEKGGFVDEIHHKKIIDKVKEYAFQNNFELIKIAKSVIKGNKSKNQEYISLFKRKI